jgi:drug/metabolite transporter (DMT)-like permease
MVFLGEIAALSAAGLWSSSSFLFTEASIRLGSFQLNTDRMIMAALLLLITIYLFGINTDLSSTQILLLSVSGFVGLVIGDTFLFAAFKEIGPRISMLIMSFNPAIAGFMAYFILDEVIGGWGIFGIALTLTGIVLVIKEKPRQQIKNFKVTKAGVFFGFMAAAGQGSGLIFAKMAQNIGDIHSLTATIVRIIAAIIMMIPLSIFLRRYKNPLGLYTRDKKALGMVFLGSILGPYLGITFSYLAIINTKVGIASTLMATVPIIMLPLSRMIYKEKLTPAAVGGALIAVVGVSMLFLV